jgi:hypothetical protein
MKGKPDVRKLVQDIQRHRDVVRRDVYRAFYYLEQGWMEIDDKDQCVLSNFLKQKREERELEWRKALEMEEEEEEEWP